MKQYNLGFVSDDDIYNHVRSTVLQYRRSINLKEFNKNIIDPIKLTFDSKIYGQTMAQTIESDVSARLIRPTTIALAISISTFSNWLVMDGKCLPMVIKAASMY